MKCPQCEAKATQVFISFRSRDETLAKGLQDHLAGNGIKSFLGAVSLPYIGESGYAKAIDKALESARWLVVMGTSPESFDSSWVGYEWRSFLNEIHSGRKAGGQLFTFVSGVMPDQLPFALRSQQMIPFSTFSPQDGFESLAAYLRQALARLNGPAVHLAQ